MKVQTSVPGTFPTELGAALTAIRADPNSGFPFKSVVPLWSRQVNSRILLYLYVYVSIYDYRCMNVCAYMLIISPHQISRPSMVQTGEHHAMRMIDSFYIPFVVIHSIKHHNQLTNITTES